MQIVDDPKEMQEICASWRCGGLSIGFVPTMGALHQGHLELARRAKAGNDRFVSSIFVNPAQFGPQEDLAKYPRTLETDFEGLQEAGCDAVFVPTAEVMYGSRDLLHGTWIDVTPFDEMWEGVTRPGHLRGVATVVAKLFNITCPRRAYFGEKDYQQLKVVEALVRDLNFAVQIVPVPTVREADGLAMSSRNQYLEPEDRAAATVIYRAMTAAREAVASGEKDVAAIGRIAQSILDAEPRLRTQYVAIVDGETLAALHEIPAGRAARILVAAYFGKTRLIDNLALETA